MNSSPLVSIGVPVYNAAPWLQATVQSLLAQTFTDLELILSDNASTDNSAELCTQLQRMDSRVRYHRNARNIGANKNYLAVLAHARGKYFKWASASDLLAPTFIERCVQALEVRKDAVLACSHTGIFTHSVNDAVRYECDRALLAEDSVDRFIELLRTMQLNNLMNGLIRRDDLVRVRPMGNFHRGDVVAMAELALRGKFLLLPEVLFFRRMDATTATKLKNEMDVERHFHPQARRPQLWQYWKYHIALLRGALRSAPRVDQKMQASCYALRSMTWSRGRLTGEIKDALHRAIHH